MLELNPEDLKPPPWTRVSLEPGRVTRQDFALEDGAVLEGRVTDSVTGAPIAGAEVCESWVFDRVGRSGADGRYRLAGAEGVNQLHARAPGYGRTEVELGEPQPAVVDIALQPARTATGRVLLPAGAPAAGAYVAAATSTYAAGGQAIDWQSARTSGDGSFVLRDLRPDLVHALFVRHAGYGTVIREFPEDEQEQTAIQLEDVVLLPPASLAGIVEDETGQGLPDHEIVINGPETTGSWRELDLARGLRYYLLQRSARTDDLGRFRCTDLGPGPYTVQVELRDRPAPAVEAVVLESGEHHAGIRFVVSSGLAIAGTARDPSGAPRGDVYVSLTNEAADTDLSCRPGPDGRFHFKGLSAGSYRLEFEPLAWGEGGTPPRRIHQFQEDGVKAGDEEISIVLPWSATITGTVLDPAGAPVNRLTVWALQGKDSVASAQCGDDGRFELWLADGDLVDLLVETGRSREQQRLLRELGYATDPARKEPEQRSARLAGVLAGTRDLLLQLQ